MKLLLHFIKVFCRFSEEKLVVLFPNRPGNPNSVVIWPVGVFVIGTSASTYQFPHIT